MGKEGWRRNVEEILFWVETVGISAVIVVLLLTSIVFFRYGSDSVALVLRGYEYAAMWGSLAALLFLKTYQAAKKEVSHEA